MMDPLARYELIDQEDFKVSPSSNDLMNTSSGISFPCPIDFECFADKPTQGLMDELSLSTSSPSSLFLAGGRPPALYSTSSSPNYVAALPLSHNFDTGFAFPLKEPQTTFDAQDSERTASRFSYSGTEDPKKKLQTKSAILTSECIEIMKKSRQLNEMEGGPKQVRSAFNFNPMKKRKVRSNPREWRILYHNLTKDQCIEYLKYHRWKEPVTNAPKGTGCRVSQCAIHAGCNHLLKMR